MNSTIEDEINSLRNDNAAIILEIEMLEYERNAEYGVGEDQFIEERWAKFAANSNRIHELLSEG